MPEEIARKLRHLWEYRARIEQQPPPGDWRVWLLLAGRGFGKTRTGAEYVRACVNQGLARRIALVAPTALDARSIMVEGESGLLSIGPPKERPEYEPSLHRLTWHNGAVATLFSADEPNRLRGPQHDLAWCDELAAWRYPQGLGHADVRIALGGSRGRRPARHRHDDAAPDRIDPRLAGRPDGRRDPRPDRRQREEPGARFSRANRAPL
jgi:phage terminase large subunit-like protein